MKGIARLEWLDILHGKRAISSLLQCQISLKVTLINLISADGETLYLLRYDQLFKVSEYLAEQLQITDCKMIFYVFLNSMGPLARRWVYCNFFCKQVQTVPNIFLSPKGPLRTCFPVHQSFAAICEELLYVYKDFQSHKGRRQTQIATLASSVIFDDKLQSDGLRFCVSGKEATNALSSK